MVSKDFASFQDFKVKGPEHSVKQMSNKSLIMRMKQVIELLNRAIFLVVKNKLHELPVEH